MSEGSNSEEYEENEEDEEDEEEQLLEPPEIPNLLIDDPPDDGVNTTYLGHVVKRRRILEGRSIYEGNLLCVC
jgi:hypothetical protein